MTAKAYIFAVWAPEGDDCPPAVAAMVSGSISAARTAIRRADIKLVSKDPVHIDRDPEAIEGLSAGQVVWSYAHANDWRPV